MNDNTLTRRKLRRSDYVQYFFINIFKTAPGSNHLILVVHIFNINFLDKGARDNDGSFILLPKTIEYKAISLRSIDLQLIGFLAFKNTPALPNHFLILLSQSL